MKSKAPRRVNRRGPVADKVTINGVTDTYENFGRTIGLQANSFRLRIKKLGLDHPMLLASRDELAAWWRTEAQARWREKWIAEHGCTPEESRVKKQAELQRRAAVRGKAVRAARKAVKGKLTAQQRDNLTDAIIGIASVGKEELVRRRHVGLWNLVVGIAAADNLTAEEIAELNHAEGDDGV